MCAAVLALFSACSPRVPDYDIRVDTLPNGVVQVYNMNFLTADRKPELELREELRLGRAPGDSTAEGPEVFSHVVGLTVDDIGRIYVADESTREIRVFDAQGEFLRRFGRRGEAPGEFQQLAGIAWLPSGILLAMDTGAWRLTVFDSLGTVLSTAEHKGDDSDDGAAWTPATDTLGFLYEHAWDSSPWARLVLRKQLLGDLTLATVDTIALPGREPVPDSTPTFWRPLWAAGPDGSIWHGNTLRFRLFKVSVRGDTTRTVELRRTAPLLGARERESLAAAMGLPPRALPRYRSVMGPVDIARDGRIWVRNRGAFRTIAQWEVFDGDGYHKGSVIPPVALSAVPGPVFGHGTITGVTHDQTGEQYVVRLRVR